MAVAVSMTVAVAVAVVLVVRFVFFDLSFRDFVVRGGRALSAATRLSTRCRCSGSLRGGSRRRAASRSGGIVTANGNLDLVLFVLGATNVREVNGPALNLEIVVGFRDVTSVSYSILDHLAALLNGQESHLGKLSRVRGGLTVEARAVRRIIRGRDMGVAPASLTHGAARRAEVPARAGSVRVGMFVV